MITLDLRTPEKEYENFYFPCNQILNSDTWEEGLNAFDATKFSRYMQFRKDVLSEFRNYDIPVIELKKDNKKEAVCLVFEKVNTGGVPLSVFELITATYAADGVNLRDEWYGNKKDDIEGTSRWLGRQRLLKDIQPTDFFQGLSLLRTYELRKEDIANGKTGKQITGVSAKRESVLALPLSAYERLKDPLAQGSKARPYSSSTGTPLLPVSTQRSTNIWSKRSQHASRSELSSVIRATATTA